MNQYTALYLAAVIVAIVSGMLGAAQLIGPLALGLPPQAAAWMGILSSGLAVLASFLPRLTSTPGSPPNPH